MLVLSRKLNESIEIDNGLAEVKVLEVLGDRVRLGVIADRSVAVDRSEISLAKQREANPHSPIVVRISGGQVLLQTETHTARLTPAMARALLSDESIRSRVRAALLTFQSN